MNRTLILPVDYLPFLVGILEFDVAGPGDQSG
jgi:hypothetical protein